MAYHNHTQPLAATLAYIATLDESFVAEIGAHKEGWFPATALIEATSPLLTEGLARAVARYPNAEQRVSASFFIGTYVWYLAGIAVSCYLAERRVPDLAAAHVAIRFNTYTWHEGDASGEAERIDIRLLGGSFAALPDDPAADHPTALLVPNILALRDWLWVRLEEHLAPLIAAVYQHTRLGKRAQWNIVADTIASLFQHVGEKLSVAELARAEASALLNAPGSPLRSSNTGYVTLRYGGHCDTFVQRGGCCLYYKVDPDNNCATCVLRPVDERNRMLQDYMAEKYAMKEPR